MLVLRRRSFLLAAASAAALPATPALAETASREFLIRRDGSDIGRHSLTAQLGPDGFQIEIVIDIVVRVLGIPAYRYELENREVWQGGRLVRLDSRVNDDGDEAFARVRAEGDTLAIEGSDGTASAPLDSATTSYFSAALMTRRPWISTQSGRVLDVSVKEAAPGRFRTSGDLETTLIYDGDEWVGCEFDAGGELASYETLSSSGTIAGLWASA
ncbi:MAG: DUF6134 family protein [Pseudomonadota bacterium]